jgi:acyl-CoA thioesterase
MTRQYQNPRLPTRLLLTALCLAIQPAMSKQYHSGSKPIRFTCIDDSRWVNGSTLELRGDIQKQRGWVRIQGGSERETKFEQQALNYRWHSEDTDGFAIVVTPDLMARYYDQTEGASLFSQSRWHCSTS